MIVLRSLPPPVVVFGKERACQVGIENKCEATTNVDLQITPNLPQERQWCVLTPIEIIEKDDVL